VKFDDFFWRLLRWVPVLALLGLAGILGTGWTMRAEAVQPAADVDTMVVDAAFIAERCVGCHGLDKTCRKLDRKDMAAWKRTVKRMVDVRNTDISPATVADVAAYLAGADEEMRRQCE
jgi:mono/diheme cytochrome c family protein